MHFRILKMTATGGFLIAPECIKCTYFSWFKGALVLRGGQEIRNTPPPIPAHGHAVYYSHARGTMKVVSSGGQKCTKIHRFQRYFWRTMPPNYHSGQTLSLQVLPCLLWAEISKCMGNKTAVFTVSSAKLYTQLGTQDIKTISTDMVYGKHGRDLYGGCWISCLSLLETLLGYLPTSAYAQSPFSLLSASSTFCPIMLGAYLFPWPQYTTLLSLYFITYWRLKRSKVMTLAIALLTRVRPKNSSALQYPKWQLIGMS